MIQRIWMGSTPAGYCDKELEGRKRRDLNGSYTNILSLIGRVN